MRAGLEMDAPSTKPQTTPPINISSLQKLPISQQRPSFHLTFISRVCLFATAAAAL